ncbi:MAG: DoxX family protein [Bdellovibrio sp.]|nr:MAG: DoxX family protein [Bdellovibrio sp.]
MFKKETVKKFIAFHEFLEKISWLPILIGRLSIGWVFLSTGWGKLHNLDYVIQYFESLGIPYASLQAPFVATVEFLGGLSLILGLGSRYFAAMLTGVMTVAILTAHAEDISQFSDVFKLFEFAYIIILGMIATKGAGPLSLDTAFKKQLQ